MPFLRTAHDLTEFSQLPFWGAPTSTIDWCEPNYKFSRFVAEPLNTISNLSFVLLGLMGAFHEMNEHSKRSYIFMYLMVSCIGLGSMAFHGTLSVLGQQLDELPMVWFLLGCMFVVNNDAIGTMRQKQIVSALLTVYGVIFSAAHIILKTTTAFQVHFASLLCALLARVYQRFRLTEIGSEGKHLIMLFCGSGLFGFMCWLADYHGCSWLKQNWPYQWMPNGHVWWHLFMGYSAYCSVVMLRVLEACETQKPIEIKYRFGVPFACKVATSEVEKAKSSQIF